MSDQNISTILRIKPSKNPGYFAVDDLEPTKIVANLPETYKADYVDNTKLNYAFNFNTILNQKISQDEVFNKIGVPAIQNAFEGFNSTIFVYGQTGSGKTFTLTGGSERYADRGIIPRAISMIFNEVRNRTDLEFKVTLSYFQIYNEQGYDLLASDTTSKLEDMPKIKILEDDNGGFHLKNLSVHPTDNEEDALNLLFLGDTNRAVAETPMNLASSRSHCVFLLTIEAREFGSDKVRKSKLHLIDLAGSERIGKTQSTGSILREAKYINSSLFYLEVVITALHEKATIGRSHIPYRNSFMTSILRDSLGGNCKTTMIATIAPDAIHTEESLSTCRFAQRVSKIKNKVSVNEDVDPLQQIRRLKAEILTLREEISFLKNENKDETTLTPLEIEELKEQIKQYISDKDTTKALNIGKLTLTKMKEAFAIFKSIIWERDNTIISFKDKYSNSTDNTSSSSSSGGPWKDNRKDSGITSSGGDKELIKTIEELKTCLLQRDNEIAILVNMVKQGKTVEDVLSAQNGGSDTTLQKQNRTNSLTEKGGRRGTNDPNAAINSDAVALEKVRKDNEEKRKRERQKEKEERMLKTRLFNVLPPPKEILQDPAKSFEWFQERCSLKPNIDENMNELKVAIQDAKTAGEKANKSRNTINYLKSSIEAIRRERALERISYGSESKHESKGDDDAEETIIESEEEMNMRRKIEQEKTIYKDNFELLRILKPKIEHIKKVIEKCRSTLMQQYDQWYSFLNLRIDDLSLSSLANYTDPTTTSSSSSSFNLNENRSSGINSGGEYTIDNSQYITMIHSNGTPLDSPIPSRNMTPQDTNFNQASSNTSVSRTMTSTTNSTLPSAYTTTATASSQDTNSNNGGFTGGKTGSGGSSGGYTSARSSYDIKENMTASSQSTISSLTTNTTTMNTNTTMKMNMMKPPLSSSSSSSTTNNNTITRISSRGNGSATTTTTGTTASTVVRNMTAHSSVEDDIEAFYKAKEEILKMQHYNRK